MAPPLFAGSMTSTIGQKDDGEEGNVVEMDETRKMYEESRDVARAGSWALNGYERATDVDTRGFRDFADSFYDNAEGGKAVEGEFVREGAARTLQEESEPLQDQARVAEERRGSKKGGAGAGGVAPPRGIAPRAPLGMASLKMSMDASMGL